MITIKNKIKTVAAIVTGCVLAASCNKDVQQFDPIAVPSYPTAARVASVIASNPNDSLYYRMIVRAGMVNTLNDSSRTFTMFITDNNGMKIFVNQASGGAIPLAAPDATFSNFIATTLPVATAAGIVQYNTVGQAYTTSAIPSQFPNVSLPSQIMLDPTSPFVRMQIFPSKAAPTNFCNTMPFISADQAAANGVIHHVYTVVTPPQATLKSLIAAEPNLTYFRAAIARADSGQSGLNKLDSLLGYGLTNMTVAAPNDAAFQSFISQLVYEKTFIATNSVPIATATAAGAVAAGPAFIGTNNVTTADVKGLIAYHFLASPSASGAIQPNIRVFSNNIPVSASPKFIQTLVNTSVAAHPGLAAATTYVGTGPFINTLTFNGLGSFPTSYTGTTPPLTPVYTTPPYGGTPANAVSKDKLGVNGVYHIIDKVLLPQNL